MKISKLITIDDDLAENLKEVNASKLINELLKDYFGNSHSDKKEEIEQKINELKEEDKLISLKIKNLSKELKKAKTKEKEIREIYKKIPEEVLTDFKVYPKMTELILSQRFSEIYKPKYDFTYEELKNAWNKYKEDKNA